MDCYERKQEDVPSMSFHKPQTTLASNPSKTFNQSHSSFVLYIIKTKQAKKKGMLCKLKDLVVKRLNPHLHSKLNFCSMTFGYEIHFLEKGTSHFFSASIWMTVFYISCKKNCKIIILKMVNGWKR